MTQAAPPERLLVVTDQVSATQVISFLNPLARRPGTPVAFLALAGRPDLLRDLRDFRPTAAVLSRVTRPEGRDVALRLRDAGLPVVFHIDDDLLAVPLSLGRSKYDFYNAPERLAALRATMEECDLVYASTGPLAEALVAHGIGRPVVAGSVYCTVDPDRLPQPLPATRPVIGYMGTGGHSADLEMIVPVLDRLLRDYPSLRFETFGTIASPRGLAAHGARVAHHGPVDNYAGFLDRLSALGWWIGLAPLEDNPFNRCKADTKWVEYSVAGAAVVASDLPVYHRACAGDAGRLARGPEDWYPILRHLIDHAPERQRLVAAARAKLAATYPHAALRAQIADVLAAARRLAEGAHRPHEEVRS
ncbi:glycosyltransferase [Mongoliimonas terrestris]|uniref:glycosyltransferase n=1 Tax=Mongoliimonas terrestris TaxID=1709001 RepID=UPI0009499CA8|nr:glycosyltransferase [Mongoliimonas terrestris]